MIHYDEHKVKGIRNYLSIIIQKANYKNIQI